MSAAVQQRISELNERTVDPVQAWEAVQRKRGLSPSQVDSEIASEIERLKQQAVAR